MDILNPQGPHHDRGRTITAIYAGQCGLSLLFLVLRIWARMRINATGLDDMFMIITWVSHLNVTNFSFSTMPRLVSKQTLWL